MSDDWEPLGYPEAPVGAPPADEQAEYLDPELDTEPIPLNDTFQGELGHHKRQESSPGSRDTQYWSPSQVSLPKGSVWGGPRSRSFKPATPNAGLKYTFHYDPTDAAGQYVYMIGEKGIWTEHAVRCPSLPHPTACLLMV